MPKSFEQKVNYFDKTYVQVQRIRAIGLTMGSPQVERLAWARGDQ